MPPRVCVEEVSSTPPEGALLRVGEPQYVSVDAVSATRYLEEGRVLTLEGSALFEWEEESRRLRRIARICPTAAWSSRVSMSGSGDVFFLSEGSLWVWRWRTQELDRCFEYARSDLTYLRVSHDASKVLFASELDIEVWSTSDGRCVLRPPPSGGRLGSTEISGDFSHVLLLSESGIEVWSTSDGRCVLRRPAPGSGAGLGEFYHVELNRDGSRLLCSIETQWQSGSDTIEFFVLDVATGNQIDASGPISHDRGDYHFSPDGQHVYYDDGSKTTGSPTQAPPVGIFAVSSDEKFLAMPSVLYDLEHGIHTPLSRPDSPTSIVGMAFVGDALARVFSDGRIELHSPRGGAPAQHSLDAPNCVHSDFSSDGARLAAVFWRQGASRYELQVMARKDFCTLWQRPLPHMSVGEGIFACGAQHVVLYYIGKLVRYSDRVEAEPETLPLGAGSMRQLALGEDGMLAAAVLNRYSAGTVLALVSWSDVSRNQTLTQEDLGADPSSVSFARQGTRIAVGLEDGVVLVGRVSPWKLERRFRGALGPIVAVRFSSDGRSLYAQSRDTTIVRWPLDFFA